MRANVSGHHQLRSLLVLMIAAVCVIGAKALICGWQAPTTALLTFAGFLAMAVICAAFCVGLAPSADQASTPRLYKWANIGVVIAAIIVVSGNFRRTGCL